ncbi:MAG: GH3 auxin-responsive promoter [Bacteroidetes bacterium]|nr:MAG: GH3 auxin-responsive promoter [Bacteroidota bacterium]
MLRRILFTPIARKISRGLYLQLQHSGRLQEELLMRFLRESAKTVYGKQAGFEKIRNYDDYRKALPAVSYEQVKPFINRIAAGESDVLWPGKPDYFALSSGTSSGIKHIPVTRESLQSQKRGRLFHAANFTARLGLGEVHDGNFILFADSHHFVNHGEIPSAAISAILSSNLPWYVKRRDFPSPETQQIKNYDEKIAAMIRETAGQKITGIVALPPWLMMFLKRVPEISGKSFAETYPHFRLLSTSGMSFEPYKAAVQELIGKPFAHVQTYPASEGFFGFQYELNDPSILLLPANGIFFEFIPEEDLGSSSPRRFCLSEVEQNIRYGLVITTNAGLWSYMPGDLVEFTSLQPHKIRIIGRTGNMLNAFGEHLTTDECEMILAQCCSEFQCSISDFVLVPVMQQGNELPYHRWFIEFMKPPAAFPAFAAKLDELLVNKNLCYRDLIRGKAIQELHINVVPAGSFAKLMEQKGKTGTQQKTKRFPDTESVRFLENYSRRSE